MACERYFYDMDYKELSMQKINLLKELGIEPSQDEQFMEHFLSEHVEGVYSKLLTTVIDNDITPWHEMNCFFISKEEKLDFAMLIVFQYIRTNETRRMILDMSSCLEKAFKEMDVSEDIISQYSMRNGNERNVQGNILLDIENMRDLTVSFFRLSRILGVNKTSQAFFTSDNPIGTIVHIKNSYISMAGIRSEGVEIYFPLSPNHRLLMLDKELMSYDRRYVPVENVEIVEHYNEHSVHNSNRCMFSIDGNYPIIEQMLKKILKFLIYLRYNFHGMENGICLMVNNTILKLECKMNYSW